MMFTENSRASSSIHAYHNHVNVLSITFVFISILVFQLLALDNVLYALLGEGRSLVVQLFPLIGKKLVMYTLNKLL